MACRAVEYSHSCPPASASGRCGWQKQSLVRKALPFVEEELQHVLGQSPYLQQAAPDQNIALFHRSEIRTGVRLGKGGFAYVYEIVDFDLDPHYSQRLTQQQQNLREHYRHLCRSGGNRFALKQLQERLLEDPKAFHCAAADLAVEAAFMSTLTHDHILSVRGLPIHGLESWMEGNVDSYFIIMDRLETTLDKQITQWKRQKYDVPVLRKADYALQLASALSYLHERRILYRDLKTANIGFTFDGRVVLLDFGLVRELPSGRSNLDGTYEMSSVGTRRYMAVEVVNTSSYNDKADVYSMAMVFWELLSLEKPFPTYSVEDHRLRVCQGGERPPLFRHWPQTIQNLLKHSWTTSISDRFTMKEVESLLRTYIECCKILDETPESPTAVNDRYLLTSLSLDPPLVSVDTDDADEYMSAVQHEAQLLQDHRMSITIQDFSPEDIFSVQSSLPESAAEVTTTDISSFDLGSVGYATSPVPPISNHSGFASV